MLQLKSTMVVPRGGTWQRVCRPDGPCYARRVHGSGLCYDSSDEKSRKLKSQEAPLRIGAAHRRAILQDRMVDGGGVSPGPRSTILQIFGGVVCFGGESTGRMGSTATPGLGI